MIVTSIPLWANSDARTQITRSAPPERKILLTEKQILLILDNRLSQKLIFLKKHSNYITITTMFF